MMFWNRLIVLYSALTSGFWWTMGLVLNFFADLFEVIGKFLAKVRWSNNVSVSFLSAVLASLSILIVTAEPVGISVFVVMFVLAFSALTVLDLIRK